MRSMGFIRYAACVFVGIDAMPSGMKFSQYEKELLVIFTRVCHRAPFSRSFPMHNKLPSFTLSSKMGLR